MITDPASSAVLIAPTVLAAAARSAGVTVSAVTLGVGADFVGGVLDADVAADPGPGWATGADALALALVRIAGAVDPADESVVRCRPLPGAADAADACN